MTTPDEDLDAHLRAALATSADPVTARAAAPADDPSWWWELYRGPAAQP